MSTISSLNHWRQSAKNYIVGGSIFDNLSIVKKGLLLVCLPLLFQLIFAGTMFWMLMQAEDSLRAERRSISVVSAVEQVSVSLVDTVKLGWLAGTTGSMETYRLGKARVQESRQRMKALEDLVANDPVQRANVANLGVTVAQTLDLCDSVTAQGEGHHVLFGGLQTGATSALKTLAHDLVTVTQKSHTIIDLEVERRNKLPVQEEHYRDHLRTVLVAGIAADFLVSFAVAIYFMRAISSRLTRLKSNTERFAREEPPLQACAGDDELGDLDRSFQKMAYSIARNLRKERAILNNSSDVICSLNSDLQFLEVSPASEHEWGYSREALLGRTLFELVDEKQHDSIKQFFSDALDGKSARRIELQLRRADGAGRDSSWSVTWSLQEGLFYCVARDITAQQELERAKLEFMQMVSHDIRAPLTALNVLLEGLCAGVYGPLDHKGLRLIENSTSGVERIIRMVTQLLDLEKLESGQMHLALVKMGLCELLETILELQPLAAKQGVSFDVRVQPSAEDSQIIVDRDRISQVLINLVSNAVKHSPADSQIIVTADVKDDMAEISVADQGPGIPPEMRAVIFERFQQLMDPAGLHKTGTGLGLHIARAIVEDHGGTISVESEPGHGSTFTIRLPVAKDSDTSGAI